MNFPIFPLVWGRRLAVGLGLVTLLLKPLGATPVQPLWWSDRGVLDGSPAKDFGVVNQGQLKWLGTQAFNEIDAHAQRGNGADAGSLVAGWLAGPGAGQNFAAANIGQGKSLADMFYQGLAASGFNFALPLTSDPAKDYAPLLIGQAKQLFNFNVFGIPTDPANNPVITEAVSQGSTYPSAGNNSDWIEIYNPTDYAINLHNYWLTADAGSFNDNTRDFEQETWQFPSGTTLASHAYLVVLATGADDAADPSKFPGYLKASFKLASEGECLALLYGPDKIVQQQFFPRLPKMSAGLSFGLTSDLKQATFFASPSPGSANGTSLNTTTLLAPPTIVPPRGLKTASFALQITKPTPTSTVYYQIGGNLPERSGATSLVHNPASPPTISATTVVRAFATDGSGSNRKESEYVTATYIFPSQVPSQTRPSGYPTTVPGTGGVTLDYTLNSTVVAGHSAEIVTALTAIPSVSVVLPLDSLFDDPNNLDARDALFENFYPLPSDPDQVPVVHSVQASFEWLDPRPGKPSMQHDMEVSVTGDWSLSWSDIKKKSLKFHFNTDSLDNGVRFDFFDKGQAEWVSALALKNPMSDCWANAWISDYPAGYIADQMVARTYQAMSQPGSTNLQPDNRPVHLYINGLYWGVYFLHERPDEAYLAKRLGGKAKDYRAYDDIFSFNPLPDGLTDPASNNLDGYIDYILTETFLGSTDWPGGNERVGGPVNPPRWEYVTWGSEESISLTTATTNVVSYDYGTMSMFNEHAIANPDGAFVQKFSQHLQQRCGPGGALSKATLHARLNDLYNAFLSAAIAESARWGGGYSGTHSPPYGLSDLAARKQQMDTFLDQYPHDLFKAYNDALDLGLPNPY